MSDSADRPDDLPWATEAEEAKPSAAELEAAGQNSMFGEPAPKPAPTPKSAPIPNTGANEAQPYRVLARKYRPQTFSELIGQEPMVRTLGNAIARGRLAHAFLMTGVRGVGKTSTARLIAKALNCVGPDGQGGPTIDPCGVCEPCVAIAEGRHIDVIEMDAASHTGIDDIREIIEAVRYATVSARYKIYIIDEVHMLSKAAFNGLLKTLEEPPPHVKFLFATTEVDKLPVTVLSRTQRFDLRRIPTELLQQHFASVCRQEGVEAEEEALAIVAAAAEGSVRDGLSILDQAIAHADMDASGEGDTTVRADKVRDMLGLADRGAQRALFAHLLAGEAKELLAAVDTQYSYGVEPLALMRSLMEFTHRIAVTQVAGGEADAPTAEERAAIGDWAGRLSAPQVHRLWQLLLKGHDEVRTAPDPLVSAQMALLRALHAVDLPDPGKLAREIKDLAASGTARRGDGATGGAAPTAALAWEDVVARIDASQLPNAMSLATRLRMQVRVIALEPGRLAYTQPPGFDEDLGPALRPALLEVFGQRWEVVREAGEGAPTLVEQEEAARLAERERVRQHPLVQAVYEHFPEARMVEDPETPRGREDWSRRA